MDFTGDAKQIIQCILFCLRNDFILLIITVYDNFIFRSCSFWCFILWIIIIIDNNRILWLTIIIHNDLLFTVLAACVIRNKIFTHQFAEELCILLAESLCRNRCIFGFFWFRHFFLRCILYHRILWHFLNRHFLMKENIFILLACLTLLALGGSDRCSSQFDLVRLFPFFFGQFQSRPVKMLLFLFLFPAKHQWAEQMGNMRLLIFFIRLFWLTVFIRLFCLTVFISRLCMPIIICRISICIHRFTVCISHINGHCRILRLFTFSASRRLFIFF